jgi:hypothetical protein
MESPTITNMPAKTNTPLYIIISVLVIIILGLSAWMFLKANKYGAAPLTDSPLSSDSSLFEFQSATFTGKITRVEGNKIWLENKRGVKGEAVVAKDVSISDMSSANGALATPSGKLEDIKTDKEVTINFQMVDGMLQATTINYYLSVNAPSVDIVTSPPPLASLAPSPFVNTATIPSPPVLPTLPPNSSVKPAPAP